MSRRGSLLILIIGVVLGIILTPLLIIAATQTNQSAQAQSLPFTPTSEPTQAPSPTPTIALTSTPLIVIATPTPLPPSPLPTATPNPPGFGRDQCAPNQTLEQPCALPTETDVQNLNFIDGSMDVFSFLLKGGRQYRIGATVGAQGGLDPSLDVFLAGGSDQPLASNDDIQIGNPSAAVTVTVQTDGWYLARVTNKAPGNPQGKVYTMSARSVGGAAGAAAPQAINPDDLFGNAYDVAHAGRLAWGVPYDLSMICPDPRPGACYAGRHIFLLVPVKSGIPFTAVTYDLGAGVDTVLTLYKPDAAQTQESPGVILGWRAVAANDDIAPGWTLRSQISLTPDWNSLALLVVAPSNREDMPPMPSDGRPGRYRLIVGSPELPPVKAVLGGQQDLPPPPPPPTARPTGQPAPATVSTQSAQDNREVIKESCPVGTAVVGDKNADLYAAAPPAEDDKIASYGAGALIRLLGQCYRGWVKVQPADSVTPGWMWGPNLRPEEIGSAPTSTSAAGQGGTSPAVRATPTISGSITMNTPTPRAPSAATATAQPLVFEPLAPPTAPTVAAAIPAARSLTVTLCRASTKQSDQCSTPLAGVRVDLLLVATQEVRVSGVTADDGRVTLSTSVPEGTGLLLQLPALGLQAPLEVRQMEITVRVPEGATR